MRADTGSCRSRRCQGLAGERELPDRTVAITVDDTYRSILTEAMPRFLDRGFPFTVFINTDAVNNSLTSVSWDDVRAMHEAGVAIGGQSAGHGHMAFMDRGRIEEDLARMTSDFINELGFVPKLFAYPYGDSVRNWRPCSVMRLRRRLRPSTRALPSRVRDTVRRARFALNERFRYAGGFRTIVEALSLPVTDSLPLDMVIPPPQSQPPHIGFTVAE